MSDLIVMLAVWIGAASPILIVVLAVPHYLRARKDNRCRW
jgi:hypothetical protein